MCTQMYRQMDDYDTYDTLNLPTSTWERKIIDEMDSDFDSNADMYINDELTDIETADGGDLSDSDYLDWYDFIKMDPNADDIVDSISYTDYIENYDIPEHNDLISETLIELDDFSQSPYGDDIEYGDFIDETYDLDN